MFEIADYSKLVANKPMPDSHQKDENSNTIRRNVIQLNNSIIPGAPYLMVTWYNRQIGPIPEEHVHDFDEYVGFVSSDPNDTEDLGCTIRFYMAGKWLELKKSTILFIPAGVTHCPYYLEDVRRPVLHFSGAPSGRYELMKPEDAYYVPENVEKLISQYVRPAKPGGKETSPEIMRKLVWIDDCCVKGAPYFEIMYFMKPRDPLPPTHVHDFDEIIGFVGSDPGDPENLGGTVKFMIEDEWLTLTKSSVIHVPAGLRHSPFVIEEMTSPIVHFSGGPNIPDKTYDYDISMFKDR